MKIQIFDVEHGGCALLTADNGARILIDCGHNTTTGWRPSSYLRALGVTRLEELIITNYDEDHASDLPNIANSFEITTLTTNRSVSADDILRLKRHNGMGSGIEALVRLKRNYNTPVPSGGTFLTPGPFGNFSERYFRNDYPTQFRDENNLSLVAIIEANGLTICFPGDMEVAGWKALLRNPSFVQAIREVNVFVASHHGRENGCCDELYSYAGMKPTITIISDSGVQYATQETIGWYRSRTKGISLNGETRHVLTTRRDGQITIDVHSAGSRVSVSKGLPVRKLLFL